MTGTGDQIIAYLYAQEDRKKVWDLMEHKDKRSLTQNGYYWKLNALLARKLKISTARLHNILLRQCAAPFRIGDKVSMTTIPDTDEAEDQVLESMTYHLKPTSGTITGNDGIRYRWYLNLQGSSTFNVEQFGRLLDLLIEECRQQGIETLPQDELIRMRQHELLQEQKKSSMCDTTGSTGEGGAEG